MRTFCIIKTPHMWGGGFAQSASRWFRGGVPLVVAMITLFSTSTWGQLVYQQLNCNPNTTTITVGIDPLNPCYIVGIVDPLPANVTDIIWAIDLGTPQQVQYVTTAANDFIAEGLVNETECGLHTVKVIMKLSSGPSLIYDCTFIGFAEKCALGVSAELRPTHEDFCDWQFTHDPQFSDPGGFWIYDFGDGITSAGPFGQTVTGVTNTTGTFDAPLHTYTQAGTYFVNVSYTDPSGQVTRCCLPVIVKECIQQPHNDCDFTIQWTSQCSFLNIDVLSDDPTIGPNHVWDFGDGTSPVTFGQPNFQHQYLNINTYPPNNNVTITHTYNGQTCSQTVPYPVQGIFIGASTYTLCGEMNLTDVNNLLPGNNISNVDIYVYSHLNINKNFTFNNCRLFMGQNVRMTVLELPGTNSGMRILQLRNGTELRAQPDCPCLWEGIRIQSRASLGINTAIGATNEVLIEDAMFGVRGIRTNLTAVDNRFPLFNTNNCRFRNNFVGLLSIDGRLNINAFNNNTFEGTEPLLSICTNGTCTINNPISVLNNNSDPDYPFDQQWSYAGIFVDGWRPQGQNAARLALPATSNGNFFQNLNVGILVDDADATIRGCRFQNIQRYGSYASNTSIMPTNNAGYGIRYLDGAGVPRTLDQRGVGLANTAGLTFSNVEHAIYAAAVTDLGTEVNIRDNQMASVQFGITIMSPVTASFAGNMLNTIIEDNSIIVNSSNFPLAPDDQSYGIQIGDFNGIESSYTIRDNFIEVNQPGIVNSAGETSAVGIWGISQGLANGSNANFMFVRDNFIQVTAGSNAVFGQDQNLMQNQGNTINVTDNIDVAAGIRIQGGQSNTAECNTINGPYTINSNQLSWGILEIDNSSSWTSHNEMESWRNGLHFVGDCSGVVPFNDFYSPYRRGLVYEQGASTGPQFLQGNEWHNPNQIGFDFQGFLTAPFSPYTVGPGIQTPTYIIGETPSIWITTFPTSASDPGCLYINNPEELQTPIVSNLFLSDSSLSDGIKSVNSWRSAQIIEAYPNYIDSLSGASLATYNSYLSSPLAALYQLAKSFRDTLAANAGLMATFNSILPLYKTKIAQIDSLFAISDSLSTSQNTQINVWTAQANSYATQLEAIALLHKQSTTNAANTALTALQNVSSNTIPSQQLKNYLTLYYSKGVAGIGYSSADISTLQFLSQQCVKDYGLVVHSASALYSAITNNYNYPGACNGGGNMMSNTSDELFDFAIAPNPADKQACVQIADSNGDNWQVRIVTQQGTLLFEQSIERPTLCFDVDKFESGTYFVHVRNNHGEKSSHTLVITH